MHRLILLLALSFFLQSGALSAQGSDAAAYLAKHEVPRPSASQMIVCHGFGCKYRTAIALGQSDIARLRALMKAGRKSSADEIRAVADAVAWFERRIGPATGMSRRTPRAGPDVAGRSDEADCIDLSVNTTALLLLLADLNLLQHHEVEGPQSRGFLLDMRYPHATAVLADRQSGARWAIDPWTKRSGERPDTLPLEQWKRGS